MGYRLKMSAEIYDWLAELRDSDPPTAVLAARALAALADGGDRLGPPLATAVAAVRPRPDDLASALDQHYQDRLESLTLTRRRVAQAATLRKNIERQLTEPEPPDPAGLQVRFAEATAAEERLIAESQREQSQLDAFRTRKEVLKATYTAAEAEHLIVQAQGVGDDAVLPDDAAGAAARLDELTSQIEQELGLEASAEGLMELRPGAPADDGIRILFAVEPPGTALLIAVLEGDDAVRDHYRDAVLLASEVLQEARAYRAREEAAHTFGDAESFLEEFFPGRADDLRQYQDGPWLL